MAHGAFLANSSKLRYATSATLYFAQGIPQGLLSIAMPAWLASQGATAAQIGSYLAVIILPWAFKLLTGPLMDRFNFQPMGNRRPWVLGAQLGLALSLLSLSLIKDPLGEIGLLMLLGVIINSFAATQDVAVDGMAIDLVPASEHGRINAFMACGKAIGWALTSAASGILLVNYGITTTAIAAASVAGLVFIGFLFIREREGERVFPWSPGEAGTIHEEPPSFKRVFNRLNKVLWTGFSLVIFAIMFVDGMVAGYGGALMPIAAVNLFGFTTEQWSQLVAVMGLIGAGTALALGPVIDRIGAKRMMMTTIALVSAHAFLLANTEQLWTNSNYVLAMLSMHVLMGPVTMVCAIAIAMSICSKGISATQFAIYMSTANLGASMGSKLYGTIAEHTNWSQNYMMMGTLFLILFAIIALFRTQEMQALVAQKESSGG